jgi:transportin-3
MLHVIQGYGEQLPATCQNTCEEAWVIFDAFILKYGNNFDLAERTTRVLRRGIDLFGKSLLPIAPSIIARMSFAFEATGFPGFLWIAGKVIGRFGYEEDPNWRGAVQEIFERSTAKVVAMLQVKPPRELPDGWWIFDLYHKWNLISISFLVIEDYTQMLLQFINMAPDILFVSSSFPLAFSCVMSGLTVVHSDIVFASLDFFRSILSHDCMDPPTASTPPNFPLYAATIRSAMEKEGLQFIACTLNGFTGTFPEDAASTVVTIFRLLVYLFPAQLLTWLPVVLEQLPTTSVPTAAKAQFLQDVTK